MVDSLRIEQFRRGLLDWSRGELRDFPWRDKDVTPYQVLIAEILLGATTAAKVESVHPRFVKEYPDFETLAAADVDEVARILRPLGLQNRRARALVKLSEELRDTEIPKDVSQLCDLPWIGNYGANALLCFGFGERRPIVDTNVTRILNRVFDLELGGSEDEAAWTIAEEVLPGADFQRFNLALLDFGAAICTASNPKCDVCPMSGFCDFYQSERA
jgi:A/G-specific adenine glycosylase